MQLVESASPLWPSFMWKVSSQFRLKLSTIEHRLTSIGRLRRSNA